MNKEDLAAATAEFDREFIIDETEELSPQERARWVKAGKRGRSREGDGAKVISVSVEKKLLEKCDRLAKQKGISRARLVARGLRAVLAAEKEQRDG